MNTDQFINGAIATGTVASAIGTVVAASFAYRTARSMSAIESRRIHDDLRPNVTVLCQPRQDGTMRVENCGLRAVVVVGTFLSEHDEMPSDAVFRIGVRRQVRMVLAPRQVSLAEVPAPNYTIFRLGVDLVDALNQCPCGRRTAGSGHWVEDFPML